MAFLEYVTKGDATLGYVGGLRQAVSYASQLIFGGLVIFVFQGSWRADLEHAQRGRVRRVVPGQHAPHPDLHVGARGTQDAARGQPYSVAFGGVYNSLFASAPSSQAGKFLAASTFANFGGPTFITLVTACLRSSRSPTR